ncbi:MAG: type II toxin-antitoxin system HicB family antitoxin [bacterium]
MRTLRRYRVILEPDEDGFAVWAPSLLGCVSQGDTREEALSNIREAIQVYIESALKHGEPIPEEESLEEATVEVAV